MAIHLRLRRWSAVMVVLAIAGTASGGVLFQNPDGGWDYTYEGEDASPGSGTDFDALDGLWSHDNGSDQWDGSGIGTGNPGGVNALVDDGDGTTFLRLQDTGNPTDNGVAEPSNRKIYLGRDISEAAGATQVLDNGFTISFRARISTTGPLDDQSSGDPWPDEGLGWEVRDGGKANFTVIQFDPDLDAAQVEVESEISFALTNTAFIDQQGLSVEPGLVMNQLAEVRQWQGTAGSGVDTADSGQTNLVPISDEDLTEWREVWITIERGSAAPDSNGTETHEVKVYMDGATDPTTFVVTSGPNGQGGTDFHEGAYIAMGVGATGPAGAVDVDFYSYKLGVIPPPDELPPTLGDVNLDGEVNGLDVDPFVGLVTSGDFQAEGDMNQDGVVNGLDVDPFVEAVVGGGAQAVPEPSTVILVLLGLLALAVPRVARRLRR
jgi:hypothetical protein